MGKLRCEVVKEVHGLITQYHVLMSPDKCKCDLAVNTSEGRFACCVYTRDHNIYVCKFCDEEVLMACNADHGPATMYCLFGES